MKKLLLLSLIACFTAINTVRADEGMWLLSLIGKNYQQMKQQGFKLTAEDIYSINKSALKDAIVGLGKEDNPFWHFCTGEIISDEGLFSTNHHCGFNMIQSHSSVENDYLKDGFWAYKKSEELPNEGITAQILVRMEDVTQKILPNLNDEMSEERRGVVIDSIGKILSDEATKGNNYSAQTIDMFNGNQFFLFVYKTYRDVRLVGAPPQDMGKFGGDTDNWEYPRHTADFSLFRIYTDEKGEPASYSANNIPLKPKHSLPISIKGIKEGDFAMVMGFPGSTDRFLTSYGLDELINITNNLIYNIRSVKIDVLRKKMAESQKVRIQYASKYASCSNYWKYAKQQNKALKNLNTKQNKIEIEKEYGKWAKNQKNEKYSKALSMIEAGYNTRKDSRGAQLYLSEGVLRGPELFYFGLETAMDIAEIEKMTDKDKQQQAISKLTKSIDNFYKDYNIEVERAIIENMLAYTCKNMDSKYFPLVFKNVLIKKFKGDTKKYADFVMKKSIFASKEKLLSSIEKNKKLNLMKDPAVEMAVSTIERIREIVGNNKSANIDIEKGNRYFAYGLLQINKNKLMAPDANSTIRLTYGNIKGYKPRDGVEYNYFTTLDGVMEKEDSTSTEFFVPSRLKELFHKKDFAPYADKNGKVAACFISNNDITGGNSGSPVIDANGNLIGLAFDGNSEAMSGDIDFEENLQRCINLDVRYMLFIIDKFANASNIMKELKIVK